MPIYTYEIPGLTRVNCVVIHQQLLLIPGLEHVENPLRPQEMMSVTTVERLNDTVTITTPPGDWQVQIDALIAAHDTSAVPYARPGSIPAE